jgi:cytoskeletal protein RodZ
MKIIVKVAIVIVAVVIFLGIVGAIVYFSTSAKQNTTTGPIVTIAPTPTETPTTTTTPQTTSAPTPTPAPTMTPTPYVEVDYTTVGWFFSSITVNSYATGGYNYTYLVLNVNITNHGYDQVNVNDLSDSYSGGFSVNVDNVMYYTCDSVFGYNNSLQWAYGYSYTTTMPSTITLLNTGTYDATIVFQFGDPTIIPQPAQIWEQPFTLNYIVTHGSGLIPPNAKVIINQVG